jgi:hypothetical protein
MYNRGDVPATGTLDIDIKPAACHLIGIGAAESARSRVPPLSATFTIEINTPWT